jgi:hypothetical protein
MMSSFSTEKSFTGLTDNRLRVVDDADDWPELLESACETLRRTASELIASMSVSRRLNDVPGEALRVAELGKQVAADHGLHACISIDHGTVTVRLSRSTPFVPRE